MFWIDILKSSAGTLVLPAVSGDFSILLGYAELRFRVLVWVVAVQLPCVFFCS